MKKAAIVGVKQAALIDAPEPRSAGDWALVKVHVAPMCTEYKEFLAGTENSCLGHEAAGEVVEVAAGCAVSPGDRVVVMPQYACGRCALCRSGENIYCEDQLDVVEHTGSPEGAATMAQYLVKPAWLLPKIPEGVSYELASLACCGLGPTFGAFERMGVDPSHTVLVTGAGPVGLGAVVNARFRGARVIAVEPSSWRAERARELGAECVLDPGEPDLAGRIAELTDGGADRAVECSGNVLAQRVCIDAVRRRGMVAVVGECVDVLAVRGGDDLLRKGIDLLGSWHYNLNDFPKLMRVIQESPVVEQLISHVMPMSRIQEAFELSASGRAAKIILKPWETV